MNRVCLLHYILMSWFVTNYFIYAFLNVCFNDSQYATLTHPHNYLRRHKKKKNKSTKNIKLSTEEHQSFRTLNSYFFSEMIHERSIKK